MLPPTNSISAAAAAAAAARAEQERLERIARERAAALKRKQEAEAAAEARKQARQEKVEAAKEKAAQRANAFDPKAKLPSISLDDVKSKLHDVGEVAQSVGQKLQDALQTALGARPLQPGQTRVAPHVEFDPSKETETIPRELAEILSGPGYGYNLHGGETTKMSDVRPQADRYAPGVGVTAVPGGELEVKDVSNPDSPDGRWNPTDFMPNLLFGKGEDQFPVRPSFDGDSDLGNTANTDDPDSGAYRDGVIGGNQALSTAFTVTKKGDHYVQTFNLFQAKDKGGAGYHPNDYATVQVYLKKDDASGKLKPDYLLTSFHHGTVVSKYDDLKKDADGKPYVEVKRGTHATRPIGVNDALPETQLAILGNGQAVQDGEPVGHRLQFDVFQGNIDGATTLDPSSIPGKARLEQMQWGDVSLRPLSASYFPDMERSAMPEKLAHQLSSLLLMGKP